MQAYQKVFFFSVTILTFSRRPIDPNISDYGVMVTLAEDVREAVVSQNISVRTKYQSYDGGEGWYNEHLIGNELSFNELFHDVWNVFFTPSPPVARVIKQEMVRSGLVPGKYASAHIRALYALTYRAPGQTRKWTSNAINCASKLRPSSPIFVASDSALASQHALNYGKNHSGWVVTHQNNPDPPLHLDKAENLTLGEARHPPSAYYDTFVDLYLLALGGCVYFTKGGYGHWALLIGGNITCGFRLKRNKKGIVNPCGWEGTIAPDTPQPVITDPLFLEPLAPQD